jgi:hypothetical protein
VIRSEDDSTMIFPEFRSISSNLASTGFLDWLSNTLPLIYFTASGWASR